MKRLAIFVALLIWSLFGAASASAQNDAVIMSATVNGSDVGTASVSQPLRLVPSEWAEVEITVTNAGDTPIEVRRATLEGDAVGLTFFSYATSVDFVVAPGATETLNYRLDLTDLEGQATGLIRGELSITDAQRTTVAALPTVTDVRGSLFSVYGLFGIALVVLTALALLDVALALSKHRLSLNRWQRGVRFLVPGVGIGLAIVFSASVLRLWVPETGWWFIVAGVTAAIFFAAGYFSPTPDDEHDNDFENIDPGDFENVDRSDEDGATMVVKQTNDGTYATRG
ncbi:MAG: hypothetical protein ACSLE6_14360 [Mycobacterium sp.]